jgi:heterodisulfide reductase subunit C
MTVRIISRRGTTSCDPSFAREVEETSQSHLERCYQCLSCSAGCPVAFAMDYTPDRIIRMVQLGLKEQVLNSSTIWLCASCETCATRCPNEVEIVRVMDTLREIALRRGLTQKTKLPLFHSVFLECVGAYGKVHELSLILFYMVRSGDILKLKKLYGDMLLGLKMFRKGKLVILPGRVKGGAQVKRIFQLAGAKQDRRTLALIRSDHGKDEV